MSRLLMRITDFVDNLPKGTTGVRLDTLVNGLFPETRGNTNLTREKASMVQKLLDASIEVEDTDLSLVTYRSRQAFGIDFEPCIWHQQKDEAGKLKFKSDGSPVGAMYPWVGRVSAVDNGAAKVMNSLYSELQQAYKGRPFNVNLGRRGMDPIIYITPVKVETQVGHVDLPTSEPTEDDSDATDSPDDVEIDTDGNIIVD